MIFGGENCSGNLGDTWVTFGGNWYSISSAGGPPAGPAVPLANFAGPGQYAFGSDQDTYFFNKSWVWSKFSDHTQESNQRVPPARQAAVFVGDDSSHKGFMFGGNTLSGTILADGWILDPSIAVGQYNPARWMPTCGAGSRTSCGPVGRTEAGGAYDTARKKIVVYGGSNGSYDLCDTWEFDIPTQAWTQLSPGTYPSTCTAGHSMTFDAARNRIVSAGGYGAHCNPDWCRDTRELYVRGGSCAADSDCDTGHCYGGTCCESVCSQCQTCSASGSEGTCTNIPAGSTDAVKPCTGNGQCNGSGAWRPASASASSGGPARRTRSARAAAASTGRAARRRAARPARTAATARPRRGAV
jgi:hypothetical protein